MTALFSLLMVFGHWQHCVKGKGQEKNTVSLDSKKVSSDLRRGILFFINI